MSGEVAITWRERLVPLAPCGAVAEGPAAIRLVDRLLRFDDAGLARLVGVAAPGLIVVLGDAADLPWIEGISYLGIDPSAPSIRLPTARAPSIPATLLEQAVLAEVGRERAPIAVIPGRFVPLVDALQVSRRALERLREGPGA